AAFTGAGGAAERRALARPGRDVVLSDASSPMSTREGAGEDDRPAEPAAPSRATLVGAIALAVVAVSFAGVLIRDLERSGVPLIAVAFYRMAFATAMLAAAAVARRVPRPTRAELPVLVASGLCLAGHFGLWTLSF